MWCISPAGRSGTYSLLEDRSGTYAIRSTTYLAHYPDVAHYVVCLNSRLGGCEVFLFVLLSQWWILVQIVYLRPYVAHST